MSVLRLPAGLARHGATAPVAATLPSAFNLPKLISALDATASGTRDTRILVLGDVSGVGYGSNGTTGGGYLSTSTYSRLARMLGGSSNAWMGSRTFGVNVTNGVVDGKLTLVGTWSATSTSLFTYGGDGLVSATVGSKISYVPDTVIDRIDIYYAARSNGNTAGITVNVDDGATLATLNTRNDTSDTYLKQTISCPRGVHTVNAVVAAGTATIFAMHCYDSTSRSVQILNGSMDGLTSTQVNSTAAPWSPLSGLGVIAPDLVIIDLVVNSISTNVSATNYQSDLTAIVSACQAANADVILMTGSPVDPNSTRAALQPDFVAATLAVGAAKNCPVLNITQMWGTYASKSSGSYTWMFSGRSTNAAGSEQKAMAISAILPKQGPHKPVILTPASLNQGDLSVGTTATITPPVVSAYPTTIQNTYRWLRGSTAISGAVGNTYTYTTDDVGFLITGEVTTSNMQGSVVSSAQTTSTILAINPNAAPSGFIYLTDSDGTILTDDDGANLMEPI